MIGKGSTHRNSQLSWIIINIFDFASLHCLNISIRWSLSLKIFNGQRWWFRVSLTCDQKVSPWNWIHSNLLFQTRSFSCESPKKLITAPEGISRIWLSRWALSESCQNFSPSSVHLLKPSWTPFLILIPLPGGKTTVCVFPILQWRCFWPKLHVYGQRRTPGIRPPQARK